MLYSSIQNPKIKEIAKLKQKKYRDEKSLFMVEGDIATLEAYKVGALQEIFLREGYTMDLDVPFSFITDKVMKHLSSLDSIPNVIGICK